MVVQNRITVTKTLKLTVATKSAFVQTDLIIHHCLHQLKHKNDQLNT